MNRIDKLVLLWDRTREGEEKAFAELHQILYPGLFSYAEKMVKSEDIADDLLQDLFIKFWQNKIKIGEISNVKSYFYRSVRTTVLNHIKSSQLKSSKLMLMPEPEMEFSAEELIISSEQDSHLYGMMVSALNELPSKQREIIHMRFYQDLEYQQIAEITGIKYQSVINHVYRAIQVLRQTTELAQVYAV